jgi:hypothetical protein
MSTCHYLKKCFCLFWFLKYLATDGAAGVAASVATGVASIATGAVGGEIATSSV